MECSTVSLNRQEKAAVIEEVSAELVEAKSVVVAEYRGLDVASVTVLRKNARQSGVYLRVLKNTLVRRAVAGTAFEPLSEQLTGPLMYAISNDPVAAAKVLSDFAKTNDKLVIKGGSLPNSVLDVEGVKALASLPSREELLAKLLGTMQAPITQFARTLNEVPTKFVRGLAAVRDQKAEA
nr:50S ribosomal protein L10 [Kerstersia gyiorum]